MDQQVSSDAYILLKRFSMPRGNGTEDAIGSHNRMGSSWLSLYTMMMKAIVTQFWAALVIIGVGIYLHKYAPETSAELTATIAGAWNTRRSPRAVVVLAVQQLYKMRNDRQRWHSLLWAVLAAMILAASLVVPILETSSLHWHRGTCQRQLNLFPPIIDVTQDNELLGLSYSIVAPAALRAISSVGKIPRHTLFFNTVTEGTGNTTVVNIYYSYGIFGIDFGLTQTSDLWFDVTGSCFTDYSWYKGSNNSGNNYVDTYSASGGDDNKTVTSAGGGPPYTIVVLPVNLFAASSTTPLVCLYLLLEDAVILKVQIHGILLLTTTNKDDPGGAYITSPGRPGLSCSESAVWSYRGKTANMSSLSRLASPELSSPLADTFRQYLNNSMIFVLSGVLNSAALASATTTIASSINANISAVAKDMSRLVGAAHMMARNILSDPTQFDTPQVKI